MSLGGVHDAFARRFANLTACTVNYNTPELVDALIRSIQKNSPSVQRFVVFDNTPTGAFNPIGRGYSIQVDVIDNSKDKVVDFLKMKSFDGKSVRDRKAGLGSAMHTASIQSLIDILSQDFIILDSDTLVRSDLIDFFDRKCVSSGIVHVTNRRYSKPRLNPVCSYLNVPMIKEHGIVYFSKDHIIGMTEGCLYDTGAYFHEQCVENKLKELFVNPFRYVIHLRAASRGRRNCRQKGKFLDENKSLWK